MSLIETYSLFLLAPLRPIEPQYLIFFVTDRCNARCSMCFNPKADSASVDAELSLDEIEKIARGFKRLIQLTISGGEPYLREDLPEIIRAFVRESGVRFVTLSTNAFLPDKVLRATERILSENPDARFNFCISIDEVGEKHDDIRGVKGGFERAMETYRGALKLRSRFPNIELHTTTVLSAANADRISDVLDWVDKNMDAEVPEILLVRGSPRDPASAQVDLAVYERAVKQIERMSRTRAMRSGLKNKLITSLTSLMSDVLLRSERECRMIVPCVAGSKLLILRSDGTIDPCEIIETLVPPERRPATLETFAMGNLREREYLIENILETEKPRLVREFIRSTKCHCTFECAIFANIVFGPRTWPGLGARFLRDWLRT